MRNFAALLLVLAPLLRADQVVLKNGDILTGNIVKKDGGKLTLKSEFLGEVSMPWAAVESVKSDEVLTVVLPGGETVSGKVSTANGRLEVASKSAPLAEVGDMRNPAEQRSWERIQHPGVLELWSGFFDLGRDRTPRAGAVVRLYQAARLAVPRSTLFYKMRRLGIGPQRARRVPQPQAAAHAHDRGADHRFWWSARGKADDKNRTSAPHVFTPGRTAPGATAHRS